MFYDILKYIITTVIGSVITGLIAYIKILKKTYKESKQEKREEDDAIKDSVKILLRSEIKRQCQYYINRGYISTDEYDELTEAIKVYEALGGNGLIHRLYEAVTALPIKD